MSAPAFTPGPWEVLHDAGYGEVPGYCIDGGQFIIALAIGDVEKIPAEANARLIAAAPALYEAVAEHLHAYDTGAKCCLDNLRAALAQARGESA